MFLILRHNFCNMCLINITQPASKFDGLMTHVNRQSRGVENNSDTSHCYTPFDWRYLQVGATHWAVNQHSSWYIKENNCLHCCLPFLWTQQINTYGENAQGLFTLSLFYIIKIMIPPLTHKQSTVHCPSLTHNRNSVDCSSLTQSFFHCPSLTHKQNDTYSKYCLLFPIGT